MVEATYFQAWADMLRYPSDGGAERLRDRVEQIAQGLPEHGAALLPMREYAAAHSESELEELFTHTFDGNAERALEVGWHLHGENYARGVFMVRMRKMLRTHGIEESTELPDHLSHVLCVLAKAEPVLARALATTVVLPALTKMVAGFTDQAHPYRGVLVSLGAFIEARYGAQQEDACHE